DRVTYPKNAPRVVLVVCDAAVAHTALSHDGVHARVGHGQASTAAGRFASVDEGVDRGVTSVLLLDLMVAAPPQPEPDATGYGSNGDYADNHASGNGSRVAAATTAAAAAAVSIAWSRGGRGLCCGRIDGGFGGFCSRGC